MVRVLGSIHIVRRVSLSLGISVVVASSIGAQAPQSGGTIAVTLRDPIGAVAAKVVVQARSADGATIRRATSDGTGQYTLTGTVATIAWTNPHAHIHLDVKDQAGNVTSWDFELGSPNALMRRGWSGHTLKPGEVITVNGYLAKDGSPLANARSVTLSDGRKVFAGSSIESESTQ